MTILFSPVGTADPITQLGDGPMLHIVRHLNPDKVVLFLSPAMAAHQEDDGRYVRAIELLCSDLGRPMPQVDLLSSDFSDVYRFDHYIEEFEVILESLSRSCPDEPVLVNATSGTPAMEQALVALGAFGRLNVKLLQVTTPKEGVNTRFDREDPNDYDLGTLWDFTKDMESDGKCRILEVELPNFSDRLLRESVISLVRRFDYEAAYGLACRMRSVDPDAKRMIRAAADRLNLEGRLPSKVFGGTELAYKTNDPLLEYLYVMEVRLKQGHNAEFLRSMTPALTAMMKRCLNRYLPEGRYLQVERGRATGKIDFAKVKDDPKLRRILPTWGKEPCYIKNSQLKELIDNYCDDAATRIKIERLRNIEAGARNSLAHEVGASGKTRLEEESGCSLESVMQYFFDLYGNVKPGLYERINEKIVSRL